MLVGKGKPSQAVGTSKVQTRSFILCQLEKTHIENQLHKCPNAIVPGTLLHTKHYSSVCALQHLKQNCVMDLQLYLS